MWWCAYFESDDFFLGGEEVGEVGDRRGCFCRDCERCKEI